MHPRFVVDAPSQRIGGEPVRPLFAQVATADTAGQRWENIGLLYVGVGHQEDFILTCIQLQKLIRPRIFALATVQDIGQLGRRWIKRHDKVDPKLVLAARF